MQLNVLLVSDQVRGIDGTGGLGDVATGLAKELARRDDTEIRVVMPGYEKISDKGLEKRFDDVVIPRLDVPLGSQVVSLQVCRWAIPRFTADEPHVVCYLLREPEQFDQRRNSGLQAVLLARGALAFIEKFSEFRPDVIHCNDWHTGLIPVYLNSVYRQDPYLGRIATLYTAHNNSGAAYQGAKDFSEVHHLAGLPDECYAFGSTRSLEHYGRFNFAKGGFGFADLVNTVSLTYAAELRSRAFGGSLEAVLEHRSPDLCGIVNGIDVHEWNPAEDASLPADCRYSLDQPLEKIRKRKRRVREQLRQWRPDKAVPPPFAALTDDSVLVGVVTRITNQKMPIMLPLREDTGYAHEVVSPLEKMCRDSGNVQVVFLGSPERDDAHGQRYAERLAALQKTLPERFCFYNGYDARLSHLIYAAAEMSLVPSVFEPCGLTQLIGMRYGAVPVVRSVGGLRDTVIDERESWSANGFKFIERPEPVEAWYDMADVPRAAELLYATVRRALDVRYQDDRWNALIRNGMARDSSWAIPASQYRKLYDTAVRARTAHSFAGPRTLQHVRNQVQAANNRWEKLLTMPSPEYANLKKFGQGDFGPFELTPPFRDELRDLRDQGLITSAGFDYIPERGDNLTLHVQITEAGREFIRLREALREALR